MANSSCLAEIAEGDPVLREALRVSRVVHLQTLMAASDNSDMVFEGRRAFAYAMLLQGCYPIYSDGISMRHWDVMEWEWTQRKNMDMWDQAAAIARAPEVTPIGLLTWRSPETYKYHF